MSARPQFMNDADLPLVDQAAALIGPEAWGSLLRVFGGKRLYIPARIGASHPIAVAIGQEMADRLAYAFPQNYLEIPIAAQRRARIRALLGQGLDAGAVARIVGCTRRHVQAVKAESAIADIRQGRLFD